MGEITELIPTGENCPNCGEPIYYGITRFWGMEHKYYITCKCVLKQRAEEDARNVERRHREYIEAIFKWSGLPLKWRNIGFDGFTQRLGSKTAYRTCMRYVEQFETLKAAGKGMYIFGMTGSGKTHLAAAVANELLKKGVEVKWWNVPSLYDALRSTYNGGGNENDIIAACKTAPLLILDDMGSEKLSEWTRMMMYDIVNSRIENILPTIITSNLTYEDLSKQNDSRLVSRLSDKEIFPRIANEAKDYRRNKDV